MISLTLAVQRTYQRYARYSTMTMIKHSKALPMTKAEMNPKAIDITNTTVATARTGLNICVLWQAEAKVRSRLHRVQRCPEDRLTLVSWFFGPLQYGYEYDDEDQIWNRLE